MRILQLTSAKYIGGGERHIVDLARGLREKGHDVFVGIAPRAELRDALSFLNSEHIVEFPLRGPIDYASARAIADFAKAKRIDVIHAHVARDYSIAAMASSRSGIPFVITRHVLFPMSRLHRLFLRKVRYVIAPSNAVARSLCEQKIFPETKLVTIRHGLNAAEYPVRDRIPGSDLVIGSVGNLDPVKGFDLLIRAAKEVLAQIPNARFVIVGQSRSNSDHERDLHELVRRLGLGEKISFIGWSDDIKQTISGFDIFVSASRSESFGYAIADAMLLGVPVVATETEGAREIISSTDVGTLVPLQDSALLAAAITQLADDDSRPRSVAASGRRHIEQKFSFDTMIERTEAVYRSSSGKLGRT